MDGQERPDPVKKPRNKKMSGKLKGLFWNCRCIKKNGLSPFMRDSIRWLRNFLIVVSGRLILTKIICGIGVPLMGSQVVSFQGLNLTGLMWELDCRGSISRSIIYGISS
jgi:hypothetical protein